MVYTNCKELEDKTFDHTSLGPLFGFTNDDVIPFICIENPLVYA